MMNVSKEILLLNRVLPYVLVELEGEIDTRTGYFLEDFLKMFVRLNSSEFITGRDLIIMYAFLNEICYGLDSLKYISQSELEDLRILMDKVENKI